MHQNWRGQRPLPTLRTWSAMQQPWGYEALDLSLTGSARLLCYAACQE
jgi:hypothetical protein